MSSPFLIIGAALIGLVTVWLLIISGVIGAINGVLGFYLAVVFDVSISGSMTVMTGLIFFIVFITAPRRGLVSSLRRRSLQKLDFSKKTLLFHLYNHEGSENEDIEAGVHILATHLHWNKELTDKIIKTLLKEGNINIVNDTIKLTDQGRALSISEYEALF